MKKHMNVSELPSIKVTADEMRRLNELANSGMEIFPRVAQFLAREFDRANICAGRR